MKDSAPSNPGVGVDETGETPGSFQVAPVSSFWIPRLVEIDSSWNPRAWSEKLFQRELANAACRVRGVFSKEALVGYLIAHVVLDEAHIVSLGVAPDWRNRGAGTTLLLDFMRISRLENVRVITLEVRVSNVIARHMYEKIGFRSAGIRRHYYSDNGEDAITMRFESAVVD